MRIAVVTRTAAHVGGIESYVSLSTAGLRSRGHDVHVLTDDGPAGTSSTRTSGSSGRAAHGPTEARDLVARVRALRPDVLLSHGLSDPVDESRLVAEWPTTFFAHVYHGTCVGGAKTYRLPNSRSCERPFGAGCLVRYFPRRCGGLNPATMLRQFVVQSRRLAVVKSCRAVVALSRHIIDEYARNGVDPDRLTKLPPLCPQSPRMPGEPPSTEVHVVYVGRLEQLKGPGVLLDALGPVSRGLNRPVHATFAGEGQYAAALERQAHRVQAAWPAVTVTFTGKLLHDEVHALLSRATLLAVPSLWPEPFGLVGLEAASHGVPAVGFAVGGIPEWLHEGITGHLARERGSAQALADAILDAVRDPRHHAALRQGARDAANRAAAAPHLTCLEQVLANTRDWPR